MTVLLFIASCDWEIVKNVVQGNSSLKLDQLGMEGKGSEFTFSLAFKCVSLHL